MARRKRTLTEALSQTKALHQVRNVAQARLDRARREALAPKIPDAAIRAYGSVMSTYAERTKRLVERHVLSRLPVVGSGDPLDADALRAGLALLDADLHLLAFKVRKSARATAKRTLAHARREVGRVLGFQVPDDALSKFAVEAFEQQQVMRLQAVGRAQVEQIRKAIREYQEGSSMRADITHALWVSRNRGQVIARSECQQLHNDAVKQWALHVGSHGGFYCTAHDERVRKHHAQHDGKFFAWGEEPSTLREPNCRCRMLPAEAAFVIV